MLLCVSFINLVVTLNVFGQGYIISWYNRLSISADDTCFWLEHSWAVILGSFKNVARWVWSSKLMQFWKIRYECGSIFGGSSNIAHENMLQVKNTKNLRTYLTGFTAFFCCRVEKACNNGSRRETIRYINQLPKEMVSVSVSRNHTHYTCIVGVGGA